MRRTLNIPSGKNGDADRKLPIKVTINHVVLSRFICIICIHTKIDRYL